MKSVRNKELRVGRNMLNTPVYKLAIEALCKDLNPGGVINNYKNKKKRIRKRDFRNLVNTVESV